MALWNHKQLFRPILGGLAIVNDAVTQAGTIGMVATSNGQDRWVVSCFHILCPPTGAVDGQAVYQPATANPSNLVARTAQGRANQSLDCAAAELVPGVLGSADILGLGPVRGVVSPAVGMRVLKSGVATGVTEGTIRSVAGIDVLIEVPAGFPAEYDLSEPGDSGAVWVSRDTHALVALHRAGNDTGQERATGTPMAAVLQALNLRLLV